MDRVILHCDLNNFFASVETLSKPWLASVPSAVAGNPENRTGIILAKNELAKAYGVKTAETIWQAKQKCPMLTIVPPHHDEYTRYSKLVNELYNEYTDLVEPFGIDESWLDVTNTIHLYGSGKEIAESIRSEVKKRFGLTLSIGVSFNKTYAKLGSDYKKPDAITVFDRDNYKDLVYKLPASELIFVGKKTAKTLTELYITTIGELAQTDPKYLAAKIGKSGYDLVIAARGDDKSPVAPFVEKGELKSVGNGKTLKHDISGREEISAALLSLSDEVATRLRKKNLSALGVRVAIKLSDFKVIQKQSGLFAPTALTKPIWELATKLTLSCVDEHSKIRALTVTATPITETNELQTTLFDSDDTGKKSMIDSALDDIRDKYGKSSIGFLSSYDTENDD